VNKHVLQVQPPAPSAQPLDPLALRERIAAQRPEAVVSYLQFPKPAEAGAAQARTIYVEARPGQPPLRNDELFVDPYTGAVLGERRWGDITQGWTNLMPFVYRLHYQLALGTVGSYIFGVVALLWTVDCFVGAWLTFPARRRGAVPGQGGAASWWQRWAPAWRVRWRDGARKINFDLHRAGGLWPWAMLFVLAWSSVAFNLQEVYHPVTKAILGMQDDVRDGLPTIQNPPPEPPMGWPAGIAAARTAMAGLAQREGFTVLNEANIDYQAEKGVFRYRVRSDRDVAERYGQTTVVIDARDGRLLGSFLPTGKAAGDTVTSWLLALHMAALWGWPMQLFVSVVGVVVAVLSITGVVIWWQRRRARQLAQGLRSTTRPAAPLMPSPRGLE
jgi:uncharacterized iron-regulated membrane protein